MRAKTAGWTKTEEKLLSKLTTPSRIQTFLDSVAYSDDDYARCPRHVIRDRKAHCVCGSLFAAAALERIGYPATIMELTAVRDDDHLLAVYRVGKCWGAVAKSNFVTLRFREPIYRSLRELAMSYFDVYFNVEREKTLRTYSATVSLKRFEQLNWRWENDGLEQIVTAVESGRHFRLVSEAQIAALSPVDDRMYHGAMLGVNEAGLFKP